jgi:flagellar biosynthetic protein FliO
VWRTRHLSLLLIGCIAAIPVHAWAADVSSPAPAKPAEQVSDLFGQQGAARAEPPLPNPRAVESRTPSQPAAARPAVPAGDSSALPELIRATPAAPAAESGSPASESAREIKRGEGTQGSSLAARAEQRAIDRRAGAGASWRFTDIFPLLAVLGLIVAAALVVRRFLPARVTLGSGGAMEVLARLPVGAKQQLVLVRLGRRVLLLGVSPERMTMLCEVDDADQAATLLGEVASVRPGSSLAAFDNSFDEEAGRYLDEAIGEDVTMAAGGQVRGLLEKVRKLARGKDAI